MALDDLRSSAAYLVSSAFFFFSAADDPFWFLWPLFFFFSLTFVPARFRAYCMTTCSTRAASKSSPPRCVSPPVACTAKTPSSMDSTDTSNVPPPRSKMSTRDCFGLFSSEARSWRP